MTNKNINTHNTNENKTTADFHHLPPPAFKVNPSPKNQLNVFHFKKFTFSPKIQFHRKNKQPKK